jgi:hypothetical protein
VADELVERQAEREAQAGALGVLARPGRELRRQQVGLVDQQVGTPAPLLARPA